MAGLDPAIHVFLCRVEEGVDARVVQREDALRASARV